MTSTSAARALNATVPTFLVVTMILPTYLALIDAVINFFTGISFLLQPVVIPLLTRGPVFLNELGPGQALSMLYGIPLGIELLLFLLLWRYFASRK